MTRIGIIGGGITGLSLAHYLQEHGVSCHVFESKSNPGGVIQSETKNKRVIENGPQRMRLTESIQELVSTLGIRDELIVGDDSLPLFIYQNGKLRRVPSSFTEFLTSDILSWRGKLRLFAEPLTKPGEPDESARSLFERKFGTEAYEHIIEPLFGGIFGSDPSVMPAQHALSGMLAFEEREGGLLIPGLKRIVTKERPPPATFESGMQRLPNALADRYRSSISLGTPVQSVTNIEGGYRIRTKRQDRDVKEVIFTTPAYVTASLLEESDPDSAERLGALNYNALVIVHVHATTDLTGYGYQVSRKAGFTTLGVSWNASLFDRDGIYTCFLGGMATPDVIEWSDAKIGETAVSEFRQVTGAEAEVVNITRLPYAFPAYDHSWDALAELDLDDGVRLATNYTARMGVPSRVQEAKTIATDVASNQ